MNNPSILSNNCFGQFMYKELNISYESPTIDLLIHPAEYLKYLKSLKFGQSSTFKRISMFNSEYGTNWYNYGLKPYDSDVKDWVIRINDTFEVSPLHYMDQESLIDKWKRRELRLNPYNLLVTLNDSDFMSGPILTKFLEIKSIDNVTNFNKCVILYNVNDISRYYLPYLSYKLSLIDETPRTWIYDYNSGVNTKIIVYKPNLWRNGPGDGDYPPRYFKEDFDLVKLFGIQYNLTK